MTGTARGTTMTTDPGTTTVTDREAVRWWAADLIDSCWTGDLDEVLESLAAAEGTSSKFIKKIEEHLVLTATARLAAVDDELGDIQANHDVASWLYSLAHTRACGDLPPEEWVGIVYIAGGDPRRAARPRAPLRRIRGLAVLLSLLCESGDAALLQPGSDMDHAWKTRWRVQKRFVESLARRDWQRMRRRWTRNVDG